MKKILIASLLCLSLLLTGCLPDFLKKNGDSADTLTSNTPEATQDPALDTSYLEIERHDPTTCAPQIFAINSALQALTLNVPTEWKLTKQKSGGYMIRRGETTVGKLFLGEADDADEWVSIRKKEVQATPLGRARILERREEDGVVSFRYRFIYTLFNGASTNIITLTANYAEVGENLARTLVADAKIEASSTDAATLALANVPKKEILILGNSFVNTSNIGNILQEMLSNNQKTANVTAISRGYANVATYINDASMMNQIRDGQYDVIFMCGFYEMAQSYNLATLKEACESSNTALVIFPAHNETPGTITNACRMNKDLACVHWRDEINSLIDTGIDKMKFCRNDAYLHSTPLAGYVGAHMIYRSLYGTVPSGTMRTSIDQSDVDRYLKEYRQTGMVSLLGKTDVLYLN